MDLRLKIKKVLNYLNKTYKGKSIYESFNEDTASLDDAFTALREAIAIENKLDIDQYDCSAHMWVRDRNINNRIKMAKKLMNDMDLGSADQNTKLMNCALELNGYDTTFTDVYGEGITDAMDLFGQNLCTGTGNWEGLGLIQTVALISNVPTHLANDGKQNIRDAQIFINSCTSAYPVGVRDNDSVNYILGRTDGIIDQWSLKGAFLAFQSIIDAPFSDEINQTTKDKAGNYFKDYNDRAKPLIKAMLILRGFLNVSFYKATTEEVNNAKTRFAQTSHTKVDSADFFIALFAFGLGETIYVDRPKYIIEEQSKPSYLGNTESAGFQAMYLKDNKLSLLRYTSGNQMDSLFEFDINKPNKIDPVPVFLFDANKPTHNFKQSLGHTQSLFIYDNYYYMGSHPTEFGKTAWARGLVRYKLENNQLVKRQELIGFENLLSNKTNEIYRSDFSLSDDQSKFLISFIDQNGTQYSIVLSIQDFLSLFDQKEINSEINIGPMFLLSQHSTWVEKFYNHKMSHPYSRQSKAYLPSIQGYSFESAGATGIMYISSGFAPKSDAYNSSTPNFTVHIANVPFGCTDRDILFDKLRTIVLSNPLDFLHNTSFVSSALKDYVKPFAEPEAIQYLPNHNSLLLAVTWHMNINTSDANASERLKNALGGLDKTYIYEIPVIS